MPVVPPMVSAAAGAGLIAHLNTGQARLDLLFGCYAMFGISLVMALIVIALLWARLALHGVGEARMVPTLWIVLGPWDNRSRPSRCWPKSPRLPCRQAQPQRFVTSP